MSTLTQRATVGEIIKWIINRGYCLESLLMKVNATANAGAEALFIGDVLRSNTGYQAVSATTGANAAAILMEDVSAAEAATAATYKICIVRGPAVIDADNLVFTESATQKTAAVAALAALNMRVATAGDITWSQQTT